MDQNLAIRVDYQRALSHPLRARILNEKAGEGVRFSPGELAKEWDEPLANIAYHVRALLDLKLIKLVKKTQRRGAIEHHYEVVRENVAQARGDVLTPDEASLIIGICRDGMDGREWSTREAERTYKRALKKLEAMQ
jgi:DNA-binding transcriptional ArsR family regulator